MFYVYLLRSERTGRYYIGSTGDIQNRVEQHNAGLTKSTKAFSPWRLVHQEEFDSLPEARQRESQLKSWKSRSYLESQLHLDT
ncbi:MAG: GIY-YIG nuclease family protein [Chloroflexi bacterium]|nr:GIY-YIG nuclease family protein [Chloroflexota bacterium]MCI0810227.1 GIY-YIG nuclease family protein [Chloroflexota bacterium]MCI0829442.1 GIY-YIG nuclease family protein [Chloroflexota bacterium]MCI0862676.1 GIY-YIG nuclease family protein [Chloroflexota bacterium]